MMQDADRISPAMDFEGYRALREFNEPDDPVDEEDDDFEDGEDELASFAREPTLNQLRQREA